MIAVFTLIFITKGLKMRTPKICLALFIVALFTLLTISCSSKEAGQKVQKSSKTQKVLAKKRTVTANANSTGKITVTYDNSIATGAAAKLFRDNTQVRTFTTGAENLIDNLPDGRYLLKLQKELNGKTYSGRLFFVINEDNRNLFRKMHITDGDWQRTVIFIKGETKTGQDMFVRGGIDWGYSKNTLGIDCSKNKWGCAVPIRHHLFNDTPSVIFQIN